MRFSHVVFASALVLFAVACSDDPSSKSSSPVVDGSIQTEPPEATSAVRGQVIVAADAALLALPLSVVVTVRDVTYADGPSTVLASRTVQLTSGTSTSYEIPIDAIDARASYSVSAFIDVDGDGETSKGDYVTMESFPVFGEYGTTVDVTLKRVD